MLKNVLLVEDYQETREWLSHQLLNAFVSVEVFEAATVAHAKQLISEMHFDLALIDLNLPDGKGSEIIEYLTASSPATYCVVATAFDDDEHLFPALKAGAKGYLLKGQTSEEFTESLRGILHGEPAISPLIARKLISHFNQPVDSSGHEGLSKRESEILTLTAKGFTRGEVSTYLVISPNTVASHLKAVYRKLDITNRAEATLEALRLGLLN